MKDTLVLGNSLLNLNTPVDLNVLIDLYLEGIRTIEDFLSPQLIDPRATGYAIIVKERFDATQFVCPSPSCDLTVPISLCAIRQFLLTSNTFKPHKIWTKWAKDTLYMRMALDWPAICALNKQFLSARMKTFHYKFIHRAVPYNSLLYVFKCVSSPLCTFCCSEEEMFIHLSLDCPKVQSIWLQLIIWCKSFVSSNFDYNCINCLLLGDPKSPALNNILVICKYHIYCCHVSRKVLHFNALIARIKSYKNRDYLAYKCLPSLNVNRFFQIWGRIPLSVFDRS